MTYQCCGLAVIFLRFHLASDWSRNNKHSRNLLWCSRFYGNDCKRSRKITIVHSIRYISAVFRFEWHIVAYQHSPLFSSHSFWERCRIWFISFFPPLVLKVTTTQQNITLDEGSTITLQCEVTLTEADEVWTFWLFNGRLRNTTHLQKARGNKTFANTVQEYNMSLELKHVRLAQSGTYTCGVNVTTIIRSQNISLSVHDVLRMEQSESTVQITNGKNRTISCIAVYSEATNVDTFWLFNGTRKQTSSKYEVRDARVKRTEGTIKSRNISLTIYNAGLNDSGLYSCVLNTSRGLRLKDVSVQVTPDTIGEFLILLYLSL